MKTENLHSFTLAGEMGVELELAENLHAGFPNPASDYENCTIDLAREMVRHPESTFYARIAGDSMEDAGIRNGDIVVIDRALEARNGSIVVACIDGEFTAKEYRYDEREKCVWLIPHNKRYEKIKLTEENNCIIWGVITHCVHEF